jgi:hypothetical protein
MFLVFPASLVRVEVRRRGQGSGVARPRSGRRALTLAPFDAGYGRRKRSSGLLRGCAGHAALSSSGTGVPVFGQALRLPVIPSPRRGGMKRFDGLWSAGSITWGDHASGGHDLHDLAPTSLGGPHPVRARTWWSRIA